MEYFEDNQLVNVQIPMRLSEKKADRGGGRFTLSVEPFANASLASPVKEMEEDDPPTNLTPLLLLKNKK